MADKPESEKFTHAQVHYENTSRHNGEFCAGCTHYIPPDHCEGVKAPISARAWCERWKAA